MQNWAVLDEAEDGEEHNSPIISKYFLAKLAKYFEDLDDWYSRAALRARSYLSMSKMDCYTRERSDDVESTSCNPWTPSLLICQKGKGSEISYKQDIGWMILPTGGAGKMQRDVDAEW